MRLVLPIAAAGLVLASPADAQFEVFHSTAPDGSAPQVPAVVDIGGPAESLDLFVDNGTNGSADPCAGTVAGDEICMWDLLVECTGGLTITGYTPEGDVVANQQATFIRFNGGDPINGTLGPSGIGELTVAATAAGECRVNGEQFVDNVLTAQDATQATVLAQACDDGDGDDLCVDDDPCDSFTNTDLTDSNGDGIPNDCQCGDTNGDGFLTTTDAFAMVACGADPGCGQGPPVIDLWDTNDDGFLTTTDAFNVVSRSASGQEYLNICNRREEGTPVL